jgi:hypothetical protein
MTRLRSHLIALTLLALVAMPVRGQPRQPPRTTPPAPFIVVVHRANPMRSASRTFVADAFLKRTTRWPHGEVIRPVDLRGDSAVRARFTESVLRRPVAAVRSYWQQVIFSGRGVPPVELDEDRAVIRYVASHAGAVGYVSGSADVRDVGALTIQ